LKFINSAQELSKERRLKQKIGVEIDELTPAQAAYLGIPKEGPYKAEHYRY